MLLLHISHPGCHASGGESGNVVFKVNPSNTDHVHLVCWVVQSAEKDRDGAYLNYTFNITRWIQLDLDPSAATHPYRGPSLPIAETMITLLAVSSQTCHTKINKYISLDIQRIQEDIKITSKLFKKRNLGDRLLPV